MATLSVLSYNNLSPGLTMKANNQNSSSNEVVGNALSKTFNKITVQNVLVESNGNSLNISSRNPNAIVRKIKDFGMIGSVNNATGAASFNMNSRKRPLVENKQNQYKQGETKATPPASKKPKLSKEERAAVRLAKKAAKENSTIAKTNTKDQAFALFKHTKIPGTPGRKGLPLPQAVARRNARERNRVKQVNNGFAALRERIPEEVAEVFESQGNNRSSGKKLSKVETLRMAVEYIRSLERLLGFEFPVGTGQHNSSSGEESFSLIKDEFDAYSPTMDEHFDDSISHYDNEDYFSTNATNQQQSQITSFSSHGQLPQQMDMLPNITTLNGLQYIRIPGTNTYQLLTPDIFVGSASSPPSSTVDEEHFNALIDTNCVSPSSSLSPAIIQQQHKTTADQQSPSPPLINSTEVMGSVQETAPVLTTSVITNGENINEGSATLSSSSSSSTSLLLSPVPQNQQQQIIPLLSATSSPSLSPVLHQQQQQQQLLLQTLSPATTNDQHHQQQQQELHKGLRQTCATNQLQKQQQRQQQKQEFLLPNSTDQQIGTLHMIKQEYEENSSNMYQRTSPLQQQQHLQLYQSAMSPPPLENQTPATSSTVASNGSIQMMQTFFAHGQNSTSFYESVVTLKKEFDEVLLDASHGNNVLSDESMIEAIDWWDAHNPKSDGGSLMM